MLSICLPVYNFDVSALAVALADQIGRLTVPAELIIIDDKSVPEIRAKTAALKGIQKYIELDENVGRSKIRNLFLSHTQYDYLLFLDGDSILISESFLENYIQQLSKAPVICGGRLYPSNAPVRKYRLRWKYGREKESQTAIARRKAPYQSFMTNNFIVHRKTLHAIPFDEGLSEYGHEDTLFGYHLKKAKVPVWHINNPILNGDIESNEAYLIKTEKGLGNLILILQNIENPDEFRQEVTLLKFDQKIRNAKLNGVLGAIFWLKKPVFKWLLKRGLVCLMVFNFYKWGLLNQLQKKSASSAL